MEWAGIIDEKSAIDCSRSSLHPVVALGLSLKQGYLTFSKGFSCQDLELLQGACTWNPTEFQRISRFLVILLAELLQLNNMGSLNCEVRYVT